MRIQLMLMKAAAAQISHGDAERGETPPLCLLLEIGS